MLVHFSYISADVLLVRHASYSAVQVGYKVSPIGNSKTTNPEIDSLTSSLADPPTTDNIYQYIVYIVGVTPNSAYELPNGKY